MNNSDPQPSREVSALAELARRTAVTVGVRALERRRSALDLDTKSSPTDMVTNVDRESEELIVSSLLHVRPHDAILGEEGGERRGTSGVRWVIDPIDGTTNFVYGQYAWNVSIAAERDGRAVAAAVYVPPIGELFWAGAGLGAFLVDRDGNERRLQLGTATNLSTALVGTGFAYDATTRARQGHIVGRLLPQVRDIRRMGAAALDLCFVAAGRLDAHYETGLSPWDLAAGGLIAREAGALTEDLRVAGMPAERAVIAGHPELVGQLRAAILAADAEWDRTRPGTDTGVRRPG